MLRIEDFIELENCICRDYVSSFRQPWELLRYLRDYIPLKGKELTREYEQRYPFVWVHKTAVIAEDATVEPFCIIGPGTVLRKGAYLRGGVITGSDCIIGNSTEVKNSLLLDRVQLPHFNYAGDSVLGNGAHLGAGAVLSNVKGDKSRVRVHYDGEVYDSGLRKLGALVGDGAEIGCGCVINPGSLIGKGARLYPLCSVRGQVSRGSIYKSADNIVSKE